MSLRSTELIESHLIEKTFPLDKFVLAALEKGNWKVIDDYFLMEAKPEGVLYKFLSEFLEFESIEHIIAIRQPPEDEDGIWHDDGSRILGFSLSLSQNHDQISGGELRFRPKGQSDFHSITTRPLGQMLLFKTGIYGFEHMVTAVTKGKRVVIAGWCS
jgi:hypothetical protein